ncbi:MAG TPA: hypothetical protein VM123_07970 [archaeon]|nr:hypothetical protein [archaeon]
MKEEIKHPVENAAFVGLDQGKLTCKESILTFNVSTGKQKPE